MHASVMTWLREQTEGLDLSTARVLEVGAYNVNGSPREVFGPLCAEYVGIDLRPGPDVDAVMDVADVPMGSFDVVVSTSTIEHAEDWRRVVAGMKDALTVGGLLLVTAPGPAFGRHEYPNDFWRFTVTDMERIFADMDDVKAIPDPLHSGVFVSAREPSDFYLAVDLDMIEVMAVP